MGEYLRRLIVFPHAGSLGQPYASWAGEFQQRHLFEVVCRLRGPASQQDAAGIVAYSSQVAERLLGHYDADLVLYGHSFGALIAFEVALALRRAGYDMVSHLAISGCVAPQEVTGELCLIPPAFQGMRIGEVPDRILTPILFGRELVDEDSVEFVALCLNQLRADLADWQSYIYKPGEMLSCPVMVMHGARESWPQGMAHGWSRISSGRTSFVTLEGEHMEIVAAPNGVRSFLWDLLDGVSSLRAGGAAT
jgi:medium-chain acyl-[acyl-carrier-protein] hydrolase